MLYQDTLLTIAQIAATFIGFSTIFVVFRSEETKLNRYLFRSVAEIGLAVLFGTLLPIVAYGFLGPSGVHWRIASGVFAAMWIVGLIADIKNLTRLGLPATFTGAKGSPDSMLNSVGILALLFNVIIPTVYAPTIYIVASICLLFVCGFSFVIAAFRKGEPDSQ